MSDRARLTEQVLEQCQIRRVRAKGPLRVPYTYVLRHLERWGLLGKEFTLQELAPVLIFAKQREATDPYRCVSMLSVCRKLACLSMWAWRPYPVAVLDLQVCAAPPAHRPGL